jgi:hypothetical protein
VLGLPVCVICESAAAIYITGPARWFTGLSFNQEVSAQLNIVRNRHGRFHEASLILELFEQIVQQCMNVGLLKRVDPSVDGTQIRTDATPDRTITPRAAAGSRQSQSPCARVCGTGRARNLIPEPAQSASARQKVNPNCAARIGTRPMKISTTHTGSSPVEKLSRALVNTAVCRKLLNLAR